MRFDLLILRLLFPFWLPVFTFAAEDEGRTEEPTEHKLRKAREEGKVAKSGEFTSALVLLFGVITLGLVSTYFLRNTLDMLKFFFQGFPEIDITTQASLLPIFFKFFLRLVLPVVLVAFVTALLGNLLQVGFLFSVKPITPDFSRIIPHFGRFFKKAFFSGEALFNLGKTLFKVVVIGVIVYLNIMAEVQRIMRLLTVPFLVSFGLIASIAFRIVVESAIAMLILSFFDYLFQRRQHIESLKMSKQEVKEERRMYEGDPLIKGRLRERMRQILTRNMLQAVPRADVVITNPTHYSVAMEYNRVVSPAPVVVAKGVDSMALKIREIAEENSVPLMENKPLARALYREVEIGDEIPEQYYEVLATILAEVYRLNNETAEAV